jgi:hypothetical protein
MEATFNYKEIITKDLEELTPDLIQEVIDFIEFLKSKKLKRAGIDYHSLIIQQESIGRIWNNESEDLYEL